MPAVQFLSDRFLRFLLLPLALLAAYAGSAPVATAQINTSINESVWEMYYGLNPNQVTAAWLANQLPAGTNPLLPNSQLQVSTFSSNGTTVSLTFPSVAHKVYTLQYTSSLNPPSWVSTGSPIVGDGTAKTLTASKSLGSYFHVQVSDQSTAGDNVSDWAKSILGYSISSSISAQTTYTAPTLATALSTQNAVTVTATDPTGSQPQSATAAALNIATITIARAGYQTFNAITVPLVITGTAVAGVDYTALPTSVTFPAGVNTIPLNVTPLYNPAQFSTTTVIVTAQAGGGYSLGTPSSASVLIYPSVVPAGTGLTGHYFNGAIASVPITAISVTSPCQITASVALPIGAIVTISGVTGGTFSSNINSTFTATQIAPTTSTIYSVPVNCTSNSGLSFSNATISVVYAPLSSTTSNLGNGVCTYSYNATNGGQAIITYTNSGTPATAFAAGGLVSLQFLTGTLAGGNGTGFASGSFDTNYTIKANAGTQFSVPASAGGSAAGGFVVVTPYYNATTTKVDSDVDFVWNGAAPASGITANGPFTVRWTGQVLATFTEPYFFSVKSTQACKLWVNGQKILDSWQAPTVSVTSSSTASNSVTVASTSGLAVNQGFLGSQITAINSSTGTVTLAANANANISTPTSVSYVTDKVSSSISLQAGVFYDIKLEYLSADPLEDEVHLQWFNNDMSEQVIPQSNLYPNITGFGAAAATAVTSAVSTAYVVGSGLPYTYTITGSNGATTYTASNLPSWLTLSGNVLSGTPPAAGTYQFVVTATNSGGSSSVVVTINAVDPPGNITRDIWTGLAGANVYNIPTTTTPGTTDTSLTSIEDTNTYANNTGERLRGYFTAPTTANYYFWIAGTNAGELWISDDNQKVNLVRRAYFTATTGSRIWNTQTTQQSPWLSLVAGQKYYFEVLHNTGSVGSSSNLSVAWVIDPTGTSGGIADNVGPAQPSVGGIVPAAELWPWDNPTTTNTAGSIYLANLAPVSGATTTASGGAYLSVNGSTGLLHLNYSGLSSGTLWRRVYTGPTNSPTLLFDLDAQDKNFPAQKTSDGGYTWSISNLSTLTSGQAYLTVATQNNPAGELSGSFAVTTGSQTPPAVPSYPSYTDDHSTVAGASRFLTQATFGPSPSDIAYVQANGFRAWIENQFTTSPTTNVPYVLSHLSADPQNPYVSTLFFNSWWKNAVTAPDQLRQRIAFALSEIMVVSDNNSGINNLGEPEASYYDMLLNDSFTNYATLLYDATLHPAMGDYLNMQGNSPGNIQTGLHPNENYAREIMQLFSIGLYKLWPDGSLVLDDNGEPIPTYNQSVITGMAGVMTGWTWCQAVNASTGRLSTSFGPAVDWFDPMVLVPTQHTLTQKIVLDNAVIPAATITTQSNTTTGAPPITILTLNSALGQGNTVASTITNDYDLNGLQDLQTALSMISNHAAVGPFICRQLIQRLVESNPSAAYVYRVVRAFNGQQNVDGVQTGVVGDLKDTIRAILLDPEARNSTAAIASTTIGKQREPLLQVTAPCRAFPILSTTSANYRQLGGQLMMFNTYPTQHRLVNGDVFLLDNISDSDSPAAPPVSTAYSVGNASLTYNVLSTSPTVATMTVGNGVAYQNGDTIYLQFTTGTLGTTSPYNTLLPYTIQGVTATTFNVPLSGSYSGATGSVSSPYNFTITSNQLVSKVFTTSGTTATISDTGHTVGETLYLTFINGSGNIANGSFNGLYTVTSQGASTFTVTLNGTPSANTTSSSGTSVVIPEYAGGYTVTNSNGNSTITFQTSGAHNFQVNDHVWIDFGVTISPNGAPNQLYQVTSIPANNEFAVTLTGTTLTTGTESTNGYVAYPQIVTNLTRHGTANLDMGTFNLSYTTQFIQTPLDAPTVFNYFYPNYEYPGAIETAGLTTPEFELTNASNSMTMINSLTAGILNAVNTNGYTSFSGGSGTIVMDLGTYMTQAQTADSAIPGLVTTLGNILTGGDLKSATATTISNYVANDTNFPLSATPTNTQMSNRVRAIVQLIITSAEFAIQK